ncbi:hypothetical protein ND861_05115 [Leptospira sp. 2 VSF19]|uniref:Lipoprotein n=1 Tax=Leptospira soteropolitanensis TaxID=2950025 RepID=A0AAW5VJH5_9LEPT|nr:hypothetical protein [Leptospira soteropolitanensis]MCW7492032.1 hypothetical protein [Leptospira soteropolitanensis]MCW7499614.1 hypothetical protein [Leptospira soteropolitanensis]MCW7521865.1 hypothetical protein [Leptospira soteropolitanensis]MCW7525719.1 hypothetical protein [Leptospira soteropolitanensis]MCW7530167.1 hypothetical protein [Leptospira soteropolitanensis]
MLRFLPFLLLILWSCTPTTQTEIYRFDQIIVSRNPTNAPPAFPQSFFPEKLKFLQSSEFKTSHIHTKEAYLLMETEESIENIRKRIETRAAQGDWKLIDQSENNGEITYLLEGFIKKSLSIMISDSGSSTHYIRFYFKKHSSY